MRHKRITGYGVGMLALLGQTIQGNDVYSHTFFSVRSVFQTAFPEKETMFRVDRADKKYDGIGGAFEIVGLYSESTKSNDLAKFFLPFGKTCLNVMEFNPQVNSQAQDLNNAKDIEARHFNIQTVQGTFQSRISICPKQKVGGIGIAYRQTLWRDCETEDMKLWLDVSFPVVKVTNQVILEEKVLNTGGGAIPGVIGLDGAPRVGTMRDAFKQTQMKYGRIDGKACSRWGVADVEVKFGWGTLWGDCCHLDGYVGFVAPTGTKIDQNVAARVFAPVVGDNHHWGIIFGNYSYFDVWCHNEHAIRLAYNMNGRILFKNHQWRSFDLKQKDWGRYMEIYSSLAQAQAAANTENSSSGSFGINSFTQCLEVNPRYTVDTNAAFMYTHCHWSAEIGYNFYVRHAEEVKLCKFNPQVALKAINGNGFLQLARDIRHNYEADNYTVDQFGNAQVKLSDIDLNSVSHPAVLANIIYASLGYDWNWCDFPFFVGVGGSYEFSEVNTTLNRWMVWGKIGMSF